MQTQRSYLMILHLELAMLTGIEDIPEGTKVRHSMGVETVFVMMGAKGAYYSDATGSGYVPLFPVTPVDTTGCGNAFTGEGLYMMLHKKKTVPEIVRFANATGAFCTTKKGGITGMPDREAVSDMIRKQMQR